MTNPYPWTSPACRPIRQPHAFALKAAAVVALLGGAPGLLSVIALPVYAQTAAQAAEAPHVYSIPSGTLERVLNHFASVADVELSTDASLLQGKQSGGLSGRFTVSGGFAELLRGHGLRAIRQANGSYILSKVAERTTAASEVVLPEVMVRNAAWRETATGPVYGYVAKRNITGMKTDTPIIETPQSISVVTNAQIEVQGTRRLEETLTYTPGVSVGSYGSNPEQDYVFLRGFNSPILIDGIRQYRDYIVGAQGGVEPYAYERIEVMRGPSSVLYGQMPPGGAVNLVSKRPSSDALREVQVTVGHPRYNQMAFDLGGPIDAEGQFLYRIVGLGRAADGQMDFQDDDRVFIAPVLTWQPTRDTRLNLFAQYQRDRDALRPLPLPPSGTLHPSAHGKIPRDRFLGEPAFDAFERKQFSTGYEFEHRINETWSVKQNLRYSHIDQLENTSLLTFDYGSFPLDGRTVDRTGWHDVNKISTLGIDNQLLAEFTTGLFTHKALLGLDYSRSRSDWRFSSAAMNSIDAFNPVYGSPVGTLVPGISELKKDKQIGFYAQDQIAFNRWRLTLGGRYDWVEGVTTDRLVGGTTTQKDEAFTGRIGLVYLFDNGFAPYLSYSTSFEPEIGLDSHGSPFKPTTAKQYEIGVKYQPKESDNFVAVSIFDLTRQNILTQDTNPPASNPWGQIQVGEARVRGVELETKIKLTPGFDMIGAYTYLHSEIVKSNNGDEGWPLFMTPRHQLALWGEYRFRTGMLAGLGIGAGVRYRDKAWGSSHELKVPSHKLFDASLTYDFGKSNPGWNGLSLVVSVRNLSDKKYLSTCSHWEGCFYGEGRTMSAMLKYGWQ
jgi:iron complex outermembrane receptor protein